MQKKGFILINIILIMIFLNIILLSAFTIHKKLLNSSFESISNKSSEIYYDSKTIIIDDIVQSKIQEAILKKTPQTKIDENFFVDNIVFIFNKDFDDIMSEDMSLEIHGAINQYTNGLDFELRYDYFNSNRKYMHYTIKTPALTQDDLNFLSTNDGETIYKKYISQISIEKFIY